MHHEACLAWRSRAVEWRPPRQPVRTASARGSWCTSVWPPTPFRGVHDSPAERPSAPLVGSIALLSERPRDPLTTELWQNELLHGLGAAAIYDAEGHARDPEGSSTPPRYPLLAAEVMVGEPPLGPR